MPSAASYASLEKENGHSNRNGTRTWTQIQINSTQMPTFYLTRKFITNFAIACCHSHRYYQNLYFAYRYRV
ncbi:hypothetical protein [Nostoc sp. UHCC 0302]|uniref:hypothetical protein n=1 Tax=Nostoc sp. UHCC 0302 TaxID=3134896 RepID=UPI00311CD80B